MNKKLIRRIGLFICITFLAITVFGQTALAKTDIAKENQLLVTSVFVDFANPNIVLFITGKCFDNGDTPIVTIDENELEVAPGFTPTYMEVTVPGGLEDGDYLMTVSTGNQKQQWDAYPFSIHQYT